MATESRLGDEKEEFRRVLSAESQKLKTALDAVEGRRRQLEAESAELERRLHHIDALLGHGQPDPPDDAPSMTIADHVVALLREVERPMHYRKIEEELRARGLVALGGKDPANTLLARYFRDKRLYRPMRGTYAVRNEGDEVRSVGTRRADDPGEGRLPS